MEILIFGKHFCRNSSLYEFFFLLYTNAEKGLLTITYLFSAQLIVRPIAPKASISE